MTKVHVGWLLATGCLVAAAPGIAQGEPSWSDPLPEQRVSLAWMTAATVAVQAGTAWAFRNDEEWHDEEHAFRDGFRNAPVWDDDDWDYNYVAHPWVGSEYFLLARNRGVGMWGSLAYAAVLSATFEYLIENWLQQPSATDLLVTPLAGALVGELRYTAKHRLLAKDALTGWDRLALVLLDPVDITVGGYPTGRPTLLLRYTYAF